MTNRIKNSHLIEMVDDYSTDNRLALQLEEEIIHTPKILLRGTTSGCLLNQRFLIVGLFHLYEHTLIF